jgi:hypothetical protein
MKTTLHRLSLLLAMLTTLVLGARPAHAVTFGGTSVSGQWCVSTTSPGLLLANDTARLYWDSYGNLTLINQAAADPTHPSTTATWGINASVPLTGANAANLCMSSTGRLKITDSNGTLVWHSDNGTSSNNVLSLDECTLSVTGTDATGAAVTRWTETTPECNKRRLFNGAGRCWPRSGATVRLLYDTEADAQLELDWVGGYLQLYVGGALTWYSFEEGPPPPGALYGSPNPDRLCFENNGRLVIYDAAGGIDWIGNTVTINGGASLGLDACGIGFFSNTTGDQVARTDVTELPEGKCTRTKLSNTGQCRTRDATGTVLSSPTAGTLNWTQYGHLQLVDPKGNVVWTNTNTNNNGWGWRLCFQTDGNLVIYDGNNAAMWATSWEGATPYANSSLTFEGADLVLVNDDHAAQCNAYNQPACDASGLNCVTPPQNPQLASACTSSSYWTEWSKGPQNLVKYLTAGGFSFLKDLQKGSSDFGAELWIVGGAANYNSINGLKANVASVAHAAAAVAADVPASPSTSYAGVMGDMGVAVTLFGKNLTVVEANAYANNAGPSQHLEVNALTFTLYSVDANGLANPNYSAKFFEAEADIWVGCIPLVVTADATGEVGVRYSGSIGVDSKTHDRKFTLTETPYAGLDVSASVGVGGQSVSAGLEGSLSLIELSVPFSYTIDTDAKSYSESADFQVSTLSGELDLYAQAFSFKATKKLASFDGYTTSVNLFSMNGNL